MRQKQYSSQFTWVDTLFLCLLIGVCLLVWKWLAQSDPSIPIVKHEVDTSARDTLKYWTAEKMRNARPARMPHIDAPVQDKTQPEPPPHTSRPPKN